MCEVCIAFRAVGLGISQALPRHQDGVPGGEGALLRGVQELNRDVREGEKGRDDTDGSLCEELQHEAQHVTGVSPTSITGAGSANQTSSGRFEQALRHNADELVLPTAIHKPQGVSEAVGDALDVLSSVAVR